MILRKTFAGRHSHPQQAEGKAASPLRGEILPQIPFKNSRSPRLAASASFRDTQYAAHDADALFDDLFFMLSIPQAIHLAALVSARIKI